MGKQRTTEQDWGLGIVSNLDPISNLKKSGAKAVNSDVMPQELENEPEFYLDFAVKKDKSTKDNFEILGDNFINDYPARCICLLVILGADNKKYYGTGFMISPRCVITAGHCLHFGGGWAKEVKVFPGADGSAKPYGGELSKEFVSTNNWTHLKKPEHDYGAIILPSDHLFERVKGLMAFRQINKTGPILVGGYPISEDFKQITLKGISNEIFPEIITYDLATVRGNSGSPVYVLIGNQIFVIAVHTYGGEPNHGVRVTEQVISHWQNWINRGQTIV